MKECVLNQNTDELAKRMSPWSNYLGNSINLCENILMIIMFIINTETLFCITETQFNGSRELQI